MSTFFKDLDKTSRLKMAWDMNVNKEHEKITNRWKKPYEKKQLKKVIRAQREAEREPVAA